MNITIQRIWHYHTVYIYVPVILLGFLNLFGLAVLPEGNLKILFGIFLFIAFYGFNIFYTYILLNDSYHFTLIGMYLFLCFIIIWKFIIYIIILGSFLSAMTINSFLLFMSIILLNFIKNSIALYGGPKILREFIIKNAQKNYMKKMLEKRLKNTNNESIYDNLMYKDGDSVLVTNFFKSIVFWSFFYLFFILYSIFLIAIPINAHIFNN